jgi:hypothetical protein
LHDHEIDHHDREQGRDDQRNTPDRVGDHALPSPTKPFRAWSPLSRGAREEL